MQNDSNPRDLFNAAYKASVALGRKFEVGDLTPALRQAARAYAASYEGDFSYMVEMHAQVIAGTGAFLSDSQSKGVLNCLAADARRRLASRTPAPATGAPAITVPLGTFTVVALDGSRTTIRLQEPRTKDGRIFASYLSGQDNDVDFTYFSTLRGGIPSGRQDNCPIQRRALTAILTPGADLKAMGLAYSLESSNCWRCGRTLTVPASIHSGLGPDCAAKVGAMYDEPTTTTEAAAPVVAKENPTVASAPETPTAAVDSVRRSANGQAMSRYEAAQVDGTPRPAGGWTYDDIFPSEADWDARGVR
jgi:hypothetical protein